MALARRGLTSTLSHLSRRSLTHILHPSSSAAAADLPRRPLPPPLPSAPNFSSSPFRLPLGLYPTPHHRFYSSSPDSDKIDSTDTFTDAAEVLTDAAEVLTDAAEVITDAAEVINPATASAVASPFSEEVVAAAADSFYPVAALQYLMDGVHTFTGLPWWASIALTTVLIRGATIPLLLSTMRATAKFSAMRSELEELNQRMQNSMDPVSLQERHTRTKALFTKHGVTPFAPLKGLFVQGPIFISFFFAISNMVEKVPSFKEGGAFWFADLTTPDPLYMLPVLTSVSFLATVEFNMQEGMEGNPMVKTMKNFSRVLALMTIPFTANFPKAIFFYWITSNFFSLFFGFAIKLPPVRKFLNLPDVVPQPTNQAPQPDFSFFGGPKPIAPTTLQLPDKDFVQVKKPERRISSSSVISQRIRHLEKSVKARSKTKKM